MKVKVLKTHAMNPGSGLYLVNHVYDMPDDEVNYKIEKGFVTPFVEKKEEKKTYSTKQDKKTYRKKYENKGSKNTRKTS